MRKLMLSLVVLAGAAGLAGQAGAAPVQVAPGFMSLDSAQVQTAQYHGDGWRARQDWRRRQAFRHHRWERRHDDYAGRFYPRNY